MAVSSNLSLKAKDILATPNQERLAIVVDQLYLPHDTNEYQSASTLYKYCISKFPNCLTLMLLKVYRYSPSDGDLRLRTISLLTQTLIQLNDRRFEFHLIALNDIKPLVLSCVTMPTATESDTKNLRTIVACIAYSIVMLDNGGWDELADCILLLANTEPLKAFHVFVDLPPLYRGFILRFLDKLLEEVYKVLDPEKDRAEQDWSLALQTAVKLGIQLVDSDMRLDLTKDIICNVVNTGDELVRKGKEEFLVRALEHLEKFLVQDAKVWKYNSKQCNFVAEFACKFAGTGTRSKEAAKKIYDMVTKLPNYVCGPSFKLNQDHGVGSGFGFDSELYNTLKPLSALEILSTYLLTDHGDVKSREMAIRRLHVLLCDHTSEKAEIDVSEIRNLQPLLISCLKDEGIPENTFEILGQVVFHVALETFRFDEDPWFDLWDYIKSGSSKKEFKKLVYIFQCLTMRLYVNDFVIRAINNFLPEIYTKLNQVDNNTCCWVLAFTGAFCTIIRLIEVTSHGKYVKMIANKMIDSVRTLVERKMEVGFVRRAFRDMESIVKKQMEWYCASEYRFVKGLLWKLYGIKGMTMESKMVLWRINVLLERELKEDAKVLPKNDSDWLNQPET